ncbi:type-F conjugative transfer system protein TraW [uncultured Piscinibacter sp.]|uniref:type-F conjugative transfer system protein TraW n=1 Tax=uncultured Piscinibacter sp. TaxID=1131835 RepID=UPI001D297A1D|nr:type-F conjugative transfer system protein TraW [uncultured Piscinibacter sp.]MCB1947194.1 type-F conjugative transfer system protein TraW [Thauera sp.]
MRARLSPWLIAAATSWALGAQAANLGTIGPTYPVAEKNLLDVIMARLRAKEASGELKRHEQEARDRAAYAVNNPRPVDGLRRAQAARTFYFDPTFTLQSNVVDSTGAVLFPAGTRKNPLEVVSLSKHLLFFDARDPGQVTRARELIEHYQGKVKPILVGGSYLDLMKRWNKPVFYDQEGALVRKFGIAAVPAIVSQEGQRLRIDEVPVR